MLLRVLLGLALFVVALTSAAAISTSGFESFGGRLSGARLERAQKSPHFEGGKFRNLVPTAKLMPGSFWAMVKHQLFGREERVPKMTIPVAFRSAKDYAQAPPSGLRVTWMGHATALVEIDGRRIMTDPMFSERCSPSTWVGPKRFHPAPIPLSELPAIDTVLISHDHYDHLDMTTVKALAARGTHFAVPLGIGAHLEAWGIAAEKIHELDWNQSAQLGGLSIMATPARHYSGRNPLRSDQTLWASWVVKGPTHRLFFSGDSGYFDGFKALAQHGPFDVTLIKVGACDVLWPEIHMSPEEAVKTHVDVGGRVLLPIHWGTFNLAFHDWNEPAERVWTAAKEAQATVVVPRPGEWVEPANPQPVERWWR